MLQRLPALGRVKAETNDRQFIDIYILNGLRAKDSGELFTMADRSLSSVFATVFTNPLDEFGQRVLARDVNARPRNALEVAKRAATGSNRVLACDIVASFLQAGYPKVDFERLSIKDGNFLKLDFTKTIVENLNISETVFGTLVLPASPPQHTTIKDSLAERVIGVSSPTALPAWIEGLEADRFDSTESISRIRQIGLDPSHTILTTIIRKKFFQKGAGRKEEALLRGLGNVGETGTTSKILNLLLAEDILSRFKGKEGLVYTPNRKHAGRMKKMLYELKTSQDPIWIAVSKF